MSDTMRFLRIDERQALVDALIAWRAKVCARYGSDCWYDAVRRHMEVIDG